MFRFGGNGLGFDLSYGLLEAFYWLIWIITSLIFVRAIISWVPQLIQSHVGRFIVALTEPVLAPVRHLLALIPFTRRLPVDFSPIAAWILLMIIQRIIVLLYSLFH
ncbi:YggT family protein [Ethanoligenens sp.]|uniref:YggT family protein n=1 Tax=Ethanoligenens sp. TaxID=2099655 RepID=UPI0039ED071F